MPPPIDHPLPNPIEGPGDYTTTKTVHNDTYPFISPSTSPASEKSVLISGASKGIGRLIALSFARSGASKIAIGARSPLDSLIPELKAAAREAERAEPLILPVEFDVTDRKSVEAAANAVEAEFGGLDVLINNAGLLNAGTITETDPDAWWKVWETNVRGVFLTARSFLPLMLKAGGDKTIITVSSAGAHVVMPGLSAYQTSKLAELRLSEFTNVEYGEQGALAYCVHPGNVPGTDILGGGEVPEHLKHIFVETPQLCADTLTFLTKEKREWLAGRYVNVTWNMQELMEKEKEIAGTERLKVRMVL